MFKRIKRAWELSRAPNALYFDMDKITPEQLEMLEKNPAAILHLTKDEEPDGQAEFFGEPTRQEEVEYDRDREGTKSWYDRLKNL